MGNEFVEPDREVGVNSGLDSGEVSPSLPEQRLYMTALSDWIIFMQGPPPTIFVTNYRFDGEWKRLFRLLTLVLLMLGAVIAVFSLGFAPPGKKLEDLANKSEYLFLVLVVGAVIAVPYAFVLAPLLRIRVTFSQTFFIVLLLGLPWLPLIGLVWAIGHTGTGGIIIVILLYLLSLRPLYNFCKGVSVVASCRLWRPIISILIPFAVGLTIFVANHV
jgi:hypothetical protein